MKKKIQKFSCCIIGTDTDVGKTVVTAGLLRLLSQNNLDVQGIKPVQTGCTASCQNEHQAPDIQVYLKAAPNVPAYALNSFHLASSPHLAAFKEGKSLTAETLANQIVQNTHKAHINIIEGAGGLMVPLNSNETMLDVYAELNFPVILVVSNRLGAINHALLTLELLRIKGIKTLGIIFSHSKDLSDNQDILADNKRIIAELSKIPVIAEIPYLSELHSDKFPDQQQAWEKITKHLRPILTFLPGENGKDIQLSGLKEFDRKHIWHPYTSLVKPAPTWEACRTQGSRIHLKDGTELIDGMSSWWSAIHGYNHPHIISAMHKQLDVMPHVMFGGLTHEPAVKLVQKLLNLVPSNLKHVFLADSGSVSVEVALKMALQYQTGKGNPHKNKIISHYGAYHGDTLGAMSVCDPVNGMHKQFSQVLPKQIFAPRPDCRFDKPYNPQAFENFRSLFLQHAHETAAVIIEPVVQGAGRMWFYHPEYLKNLQQLCKENNVLLILDEIATGFGRTGKLFACEWVDIQPDIMCVGKALTGGVMTLAATLTSSNVAYNLSDEGVLMHGPTFMGNPLACACATASLELIMTGNILEKVQCIESKLKHSLNNLADLPNVRDVRVLGAIGVIETKENVDIAKFQHHAVKNSVWIRPFGKLIYTMPPYTLEGNELEALVSGLDKTVREYFHG